MAEQKPIFSPIWRRSKRIMIGITWMIDVAIGILMIYTGVKMSHPDIPPGIRISSLFNGMLLAFILRIPAAIANASIEYLSEVNYVSGYLILAIGDTVFCVWIACSVGSDQQIMATNDTKIIVWIWLVLTTVRAILSLVIAIGGHIINSKTDTEILSTLYRCIQKLATFTIFVDLAGEACVSYIIVFGEPYNKHLVIVVGGIIRCLTILMSAYILLKRLAGAWLALIQFVLAVIDYAQCYIIVETFRTFTASEETKIAVWSWFGLTAIRGSCGLLLACGLHKRKEEVIKLVENNEKEYMRQFAEAVDNGNYMRY